MIQNSIDNLLAYSRRIIFFALTVISCAGALLVLSSATVYAEWQGPNLVSLESTNTSVVLMGDFNSDGALDYVAGESPEPSAIYLNKKDGTGQFVKGMTFTGLAKAVGDMNGDGTLDIIASDHGVIKIYLNDGHGSLANTLTLADSHDTGTVAVGDMDRNGTLDIVAGNFSVLSRVYFNNQNNGTFTTGPDLPDSELTVSVALGDIDGDKAVDIVMGKTITRTLPLTADVLYPHTIIYLNNQSGGFVKGQTLTRVIPKDSVPPNDLSAFYFWRTGVTLGRVDPDAALDIVVNASSLGSELYINQNDQSGTFTAGIAIPETNGVLTGELGDVNNDGFLDMVTFASISRQISVFLNDKIGNLRKNVDLQLTLPSSFFTSFFVLALGDVDNNGMLDVILGTTGQPDIVFLNKGIDGFVQGSTYNQIIQEQVDPNTITAEPYLPVAIKVGDVDNNGTLDIIESNNTSNRFAGRISIILTKGKAGCDEIKYLKNPIQTSQGGTENSVQVAVADVNNDHALDIIQTMYDSYNEQGYLLKYLNTKDGCGNFSAPTFVDPDNRGLNTQSVTVGDINGDGALDIVSGNKDQPSVVYLNQNNNSGNFLKGPALDESNNVRSLALGDLNGDGALDIVAGIAGQPLTILFNQADGTGRFGKKIQLSGTNTPFSIALGDVNDDGALDIVAGSDSVPIYVYLNDKTGNFGEPYVLSKSNSTYQVGLGDINNDGALDIIASDNLGVLDNPNGSFRVFVNDGQGKFTGGPFFTDPNVQVHGATSAVGDINNDGTLDIVVGSVSLPSTVVYLNMRQHGQLLANNPPLIATKRPLVTGDANYFSSSDLVDSLIITIPYTLFDHESQSIGKVEAQYSLDGGGLWYTATPTTTNPITNLIASPYPSGEIHVFSWDTFASGFFGQSDNVVLRLRAYPQTETPALPGVYRYTDTVSGPYHWPYASATTFPFKARGTQIRVYKDTISDGNQVTNAQIYRLKKGKKSNATLIGDELGAFTSDRDGNLRGHGQVERGDQLVALLPITPTKAYTLYYTNITPTLNGVEAFTVTVPGVQKMAVSATKPLLLFNLKVSLEWDVRKDTTYLEQLKFDLQRTSELLFDLTNGQAALGDVRLYFNKAEWDKADIRIYATNDLRPHATIGGVTQKPRLERFPNGTVHLYGRGHLEMGAVWNRYGNAGEKLSEDWSRTLAHELGHYLFFLHDNYIGLDNERLIRVDGCPGVMADPYTDSNSEFHPDLNWLGSPCAKTFSQQVLGEADWATIHHFYPALITPTVSLADPSISGPNLLPLAVTRIITPSLSSPAQTVDVPSFDLTKQDGSRYVANSSARAFLLQDKRLVNLGAPRQDHVQAWNARPGDQLCVYDLAAQPAPLTRCAPITQGNQQLTLMPQPNWQPEVLITPVTSRTISITVNIDRAMVGALSARVYSQSPITDALPAIPLTPVANGFVGTITLAQPAFVADVHIFDNEQDPHFAALAEYTLGGAPTLQLSNGDTLQLSNGDILKLLGDHTLQLSNGGTLQLSNGGTLQLSNGGTLLMTPDGLTLQLSNGGVFIRPDGSPQAFGGGTLQLSNGDTLQLSNGGTLVLSNGDTLAVDTGETLLLSNGDAPINSNDGQVTLFGEPTNTAPGQFYMLQSTTKLPGSPSYATLVGRAYRLSASSSCNTPPVKVCNLAGASISFNYLGRDVDADKEHLLKIYFWDGTAWQRLDTTIDDYHNIASALVPNSHQGLGIYALMYSTEIPLKGPGWNIFAFVGPNHQAVDEALQTIDHLYKIVWGYEPSPTPSDPRNWQAFDPKIDKTNKFYDWVNNLKTFTYGRGYWVNIDATQDITLYLKSSTGTVIAANTATPELVGTTVTPPSVYYGEVWQTKDFTPLPGMTVTAWVDGHLCGQTQTRDLQGTVAYVLQLPALGDSQYPNCGAVGHSVTFKVNDVVMLIRADWDNTAAQLVPLFNHFVNPVFMPFIAR